MKEKGVIAAIQLVSRVSAEDNKVEIERLVLEASRKASIICLPELSNMIAKREDLLSNARELYKDEIFQLCSAISRSEGVWINVGLAVRKEDIGEIGGGTDKLRNRSVVIDNKGKMAGYYDKVHLFDVDLGNGESYRESDHIEAGNNYVVCDTSLGKLGMSICFDVRFSDLYTQLALSGAEIFTIPAAFTRYTGRRHWETLIRARSIEHGCYSVAAAQGGVHESGMKTYGHSLIVDPHGEIVAEGCAEGTDIIYANIDKDCIAASRTAIPTLVLRRNIDIVHNSEVGSVI